MRFSICLSALLLISAGAQAADLIVSVEGLRSGAGNLSLCLFRTEDGFPDCARSPSAVRRTVAAGKAGEPVLFRGLEPGAYGVTVLHDENANGRLDTNLLGIPKEGVGVSTNRLPRFSAPRFSDARFEMPGGRRQTVRLVYW